MEINFSNTIEGLFEINPKVIFDNRGFFLKTFLHSAYLKESISFDWKEEYFSMSNKGVLRGMHFQTPPFSLDKLVFCITGSVLDVIVDLRINSSTYLNVYSTILDSKSSKMIFIPNGCAHGFLSLENNSILQYKVSEEYNSKNDKGILWSSINFDWPIIDKLIISERDQILPSLNFFNSPFI